MTEYMGSGNKLVMSDSEGKNMDWGSFLLTEIQYWRASVAGMRNKKNIVLAFRILEI